MLVSIAALQKIISFVQHIKIARSTSIRCLGQENPCEGISLGSCFVEEDSILNTYTATPDRCSELCEMNNNCDFWRARWDGTLCHLLISDYQHVRTFYS